MKKCRTCRNRSGNRFRSGLRCFRKSRTESSIHPEQTLSVRLTNDILNHLVKSYRDR